MNKKVIPLIVLLLVPKQILAQGDLSKPTSAISHFILIVLVLLASFGVVHIIRNKDK